MWSSGLLSPHAYSLEMVPALMPGGPACVPGSGFQEICLGSWVGPQSLRAQLGAVLSPAVLGFCSFCLSAHPAKSVSSIQFDKSLDVR